MHKEKIEDDDNERIDMEGLDMDSDDTQRKSSLGKFLIQKSKCILSPFLFYGLYVSGFWVIVRSLMVWELTSMTFPFFLSIFLAVLVVIVFRRSVPKLPAFFVVVLAAFTTNVLSETIHERSIVKKLPMATTLSNAFVMLLFSPGAFEYQWSDKYTVFITALGELFSLAQYYSFLFRGFHLRPEDFKSVKSALEIRGDYSFLDPKGCSYIALAVANLICISHFALSKNKVACPRIITKLFKRVALIVLLIYTLGMKYVIQYFDYHEMLCPHDLNRTYRRIGNFLAFFLDHFRFSYTIPPPGYSKVEAEKILAQYESKDPVNINNLRRPNIIAILSESFADFTVLGNFSTNKDFIPFMRSMSKNTIKGYVSVSAYAGWTCNSEYEFFTGNSMGFYSFGVGAYAGVVNDHQESIVGLLNDYGYNTIACAATSKDLWSIGNVYKDLKFNESYFEYSFYNDSDKFTKRVRDRSLFNGIKRIYFKRKQNNKDQPLFIFLATMQNHAAYHPIPDPEIEATDFKDMTKLSSYLTGLKLSDDAVRDLIGNFSDVKEDVVIVYFGDHYPLIPDFSDKFLGMPMDNLPLEKKSLVFMTPFFIWANYDINEEQSNFSLSYLSSKLWEVAGFPKTPYMKFRDDIKKEVPMLNPFTYMDPSKKWHWRTEVTPTSKYIDKYGRVQYYMTHDYKQKK